MNNKNHLNNVQKSNSSNKKNIMNNKTNFNKTKFTKYKNAQKKKLSNKKSNIHIKNNSCDFFNSNLKKQGNNNYNIKKIESPDNKSSKNNFNSKNKIMQKSKSNKAFTRRKNINSKKVIKNNNNDDIGKLSKLLFPLKNNEENEKRNINIKLIINKDINYYKSKDINSTKNSKIKNKQFLFKQNSNINKKRNKLQNKTYLMKKDKEVKEAKTDNLLVYGKSNCQNYIINEEKNLKLINERKNSNIFDNEFKFFYSLSKRNTIFENKNDINIIKEEKEIEYKKSEENNNSVISEIAENFFNFDDSNSYSNNSIVNKKEIYNNINNNEKLLMPKVGIKTETNLDKLFSKYKKRFENHTKASSYDKYKNIKTYNKNPSKLQYLKYSKLNKSNSSRNNHKSHICFIMNDDIITNNKKVTLISLESKPKKHNKINLQKFQTNYTEINKIQDILSHGDKTFSELAYDKGVSDVVNQIPSPNSHRGSKDVVPTSIQNPNENYGPFKSLFSVDLDKKDENYFSSSPSVSRSNSSSKVVKIITGFKNDKSNKNIKKNDLREDEKESNNYNNYIKDKIEEDIINDKDSDSDKIDDEDDKEDLDIYPEPIWSEQDIELSSKLKIDLNNEIFKQFPELINKLSENISKKNYKTYEFMSELQENKIEEFENDYNLLSQMTSEFEKLEENYKKQCYKINEKIFKMSRLTNFILQQSFPNNHSLQNSISSFSQRLEKMDNQYNKEIKNYKKSIQNLIDQLQNLSGETENALDKKLLQEIKDIQFSEHQIINTFLENKNSSNDDKNSEILDKKELIEELERFKNEEKEYKFSIPQKYSLDTNKIKLIKNGIIKGLFVKVYENKVIDIINKHGTTKRIFPDGFQISFYNNKDIKLRYSNKDEFCFYHVNQTEEFRFPSKGIIVYKFKNGQFEKHYSNYELNIKFSDGSYRIIRKEQELFQYPDGIFEFKDKKGNKTYMDSVNDEIDEGLPKSSRLKYKKNKKYPFE